MAEKPPHAFIKAVLNILTLNFTQRMLKAHIFYVYTLPFLRKKHECLLLALEHASALLEGYVQCTA